MAPLRVTFSDLEGQFCCLKFLCTSATVVRVHDGVLADNMRCCVVNNTGWQWTLVDHSYGPVDINKIGCMEVC